MSTRTEAAMDRLDRILAAPAEPSRHATTKRAEVSALAEQRATHSEPEGLIVKEAAVAEASTTTDQATGEFVALVSTYDVDRELDKFMPGSWDGAIAKIRQSGRAVPVLFSHDTRSVSAVMGLVPPDGVWADQDGLWVKGWLDVGDSLGQRLYRMLRKGALSWSVGFSLARSRPGRAGVRELQEVNELYEVSATPVPANSATRTAGMKSADREAPSLEELRDREQALGLDPEVDKIRTETRDMILRAMGADTGTDAGPKSHAALREKATRIEREHALVRVATFEC